MAQDKSAFEKDLIFALQRIANGRRINIFPSRKMPRYELQKIAEDVLWKYGIEFGKDAIEFRCIPLKNDQRQCE